MKRSSRAGFSLPEAIVVCFLLSFAFIGVFLLFTTGIRGFQTGISKSGALGEIQTIDRIMRRELRLTNFLSASVFDRETSSSRGTVQRDGLCVAALSNWSDPNRFEAGTGLPNWDKWVLFYSDRRDLGTFFKVEMARPPSGSAGEFYPLVPLAPLDPFMVDEPDTLAGVSGVVKLSSRVHSFEAEIDSARRIVRTKLTLYNDAGLKMTSQDRVEQFIDSPIEITPLNTYPEL